MLIQMPKKVFDKFVEDGVASKLINYIPERYYGVIDPNISKKYADMLITEEAKSSKDVVDVYASNTLNVVDYVMTFEAKQGKMQIRQSEIGTDLQSDTYDKILKKLSRDFPDVGEFVLINQLKLERFKVR